MCNVTLQFIHRQGKEMSVCNQYSDSAVSAFVASSVKCSLASAKLVFNIAINQALRSVVVEPSRCVGVFEEVPQRTCQQCGC